MKVPRQCPLVLLVKVSWIGGKNVRKLEGSDEMWSKEEVEQGPTALNLKPKFRH
jgi:hypothetical protein